MNAENNQPPLAEAITQGSTTDKPNETGKAEEGVKNEDTTAIGSNVDEQDKTDNEKDNKPKKIEGASKIKGSFNETKNTFNNFRDVNYNQSETKVKKSENVFTGNVYYNEREASEFLDYPTECADLVEITSKYPNQIQIEQAAKALLDDRIIILRYDIDDYSDIRDNAYDDLRYFLRNKTNYGYRDGSLPIKYYLKDDEKLVYDNETVTRLNYGESRDKVEELVNENFLSRLKPALVNAKNHLIVVTCLDFKKIASLTGYKLSNPYVFHPKQLSHVEAQTAANCQPENFQLDDDINLCVNFIATFFPDIAREFFFLIVKKLLENLDQQCPLPVRRHGKTLIQDSRLESWRARSDLIMRKCGLKISSRNKKYQYEDEETARKIKSIFLEDYPNYLAEKTDILTRCYFEIWPSADFQSNFYSFIKQLTKENLKSFNEKWMIQVFKEHAWSVPVRQDFFAFSEMLRSIIIEPEFEIHIDNFFANTINTPPDQDNSEYQYKALYYLSNKTMGFASKKTWSILLKICDKLDDIEPIIEQITSDIENDPLEYFSLAASLNDFLLETDHSSETNISDKHQLTIKIIDRLFGLLANILRSYLLNPNSSEAHDFFRLLFLSHSKEATVENCSLIVKILTSKSYKNFFSEDLDSYPIWLYHYLWYMFTACLSVNDNDEVLTELLMHQCTQEVRQGLKQQQRIIILDCAKYMIDFLKNDYLEMKRQKDITLKSSKRNKLANQLFLRCWRNTTS